MRANRDKLADVRRLIVVAALVAAPVFGSWQRYFMGGPSHTDQPAAQPLAYFQLHPCARHERTYRFDFCGTDDAGTTLKIRTKIRPVGAISEFKIFEIDYYFDNDFEPPDTVGMRSILAQTGPAKFREIYVWQPIGPLDAISPAVIADAGRQRLLVSSSTDGGNAGGTDNVVFMLLANGAVRLDWGPVYHAGTEAVPQGKQLWLPTSRFDFPSLTWSAWTNDENGGKVGCCMGKVTVGFLINNAGRVVAAKAKYDPAAEIQ